MTVLSSSSKVSPFLQLLCSRTSHEQTVHNTDLSDNVEKRGEAKRTISRRGLGEAEKRNLCRAKLALMQDLLYGNKQFFNPILKSLPCSLKKLLYQRYLPIMTKLNQLSTETMYTCIPIKQLYSKHIIYHLKLEASLLLRGCGRGVKLYAQSTSSRHVNIYECKLAQKQQLLSELSPLSNVSLFREAHKQG